MDFNKDYYAILEVAPTADRVQIKASYRRLALRYHPDRNQGDPAAEERFKEINEAHEVLSNDILRAEYDAYRTAASEAAKAREEQEREAAKEENKGSTGFRTGYKKRTFSTEKRVYLRGKMIIKYWADPEQEFFASQQEFRYKIHPTEVLAIIESESIHPAGDVSLEYMKSYKEADLFITPLKQPVSCVVRGAAGDEHYALPLLDLRLRDLSIGDVVKHEGNSYGTLRADFFAYTPRVETHEEWIPDNTCFGDTGRIEVKEENGRRFFRKEFFNPDCSVAWGPWVEIVKPVLPKTRSVVGGDYGGMGGCCEWWWIPILLFLIVLFPKFFAGLGILLLLWLALELGAGVFRFIARIGSFLLLGLLALIFWLAFRSDRNILPPVVPGPPAIDSVRTTRTRLPVATDSTATVDTSASSGTDTLITHFVRWQDYDDSTYEAAFSVSTRALAYSAARHQALELPALSQSLAPAYRDILEFDGTGLAYFYQSFDSLHARFPDEKQFARLLVSCVQSLPYFLVVDRSCDDQYEDPFTRSYLANCTGDCCVGGEKFGVRTPVEFLSDLKGDCDTRTLFLYQVLKHYGYSVALLTSNTYRHSVLAVNFRDESGLGGSSMNIRNRNYYLWETTSKGFNVGEIPDHIADLDQWEIALLTENN